MSAADDKRTVHLTAYEFQTLLTLVSMERANELLDEMRDGFDLAGEDDISRLMAAEGIGFMDAVERLCKERGL